MNVYKKNRINKLFLSRKNRISTPCPLILKRKRQMLLEDKLVCNVLSDFKNFSTTFPLNNKDKSDRVSKSIKKTFSVKNMITLLISICIG